MRFLPEREESHRINKYNRYGAEITEMIGGEIKEPRIADEGADMGPREERLVPDIEYRTADGKIVSVRSLIPGSWNLSTVERGDLFNADIFSRRIQYGQRHDTSVFSPGHERVEAKAAPYIPEGRTIEENKPEPALTSRGFFMNILHEAGHAHAFEDMAPEEKREFARTVGELNARSSREYSERDKAAYRDIVVQNERDAWAWAVKKLRELRSQGIDLAPEFRTKDELFHGIRAAVRNYEMHTKELDIAALVETYIQAKYLDELPA